MDQPLIALLLSGGGGTRLWPLSTEASPKQFLKLFGPHSLFQLALLRARGAGAQSLVVMANQGQIKLIENDLDDLGAVHEAGSTRLLLEPMRRDSAPAIAAGVADCLHLFGRKALVMVLACDHLIPDHAGFRQSVAEACALARQGKLVTLGITPTAPVSDYGYIRFGKPIAGSRGYDVDAFVEKPDRARAEAYLKEGGYAWNSGMFLFEAGVFADEAERFMPDLWAQAQRAVAKGTREPNRLASALTLEEAAFAACEKISIDYALFEKSRNVAVVPASFSWSDVGGWAAVHEALDQDNAGNAIVEAGAGFVLEKDSTNSLLISDTIPILALGVDDLVVVSTPRGVFVAPKARAADIKALLARWP